LERLAEQTEICRRFLFGHRCCESCLLWFWLPLLAFVCVFLLVVLVSRRSRSGSSSLATTTDRWP